MRRALILAFLLAASPASAEQLVSGISQDLIQITSNYTGSDIVVFGAVEGTPNTEERAPRDVVVVVRGPDADITVRRRDRVAGVWINHDAAKLSGMPSYYFLASTRPLSAIAPPDALTHYNIGLQNLQPDAVTVITTMSPSARRRCAISRKTVSIPRRRAGWSFSATLCSAPMCRCRRR
jgi:uncharacterized protein (TIGR02186 family)